MKQQLSLFHILVLVVVAAAAVVAVLFDCDYVSATNTIWFGVVMTPSASRFSLRIYNCAASQHTETIHHMARIWWYTVHTLNFHAADAFYSSYYHQPLLLINIIYLHYNVCLMWFCWFYFSISTLSIEREKKAERWKLYGELLHYIEIACTV